jgi:peptidyl-tRNA hydrolase
VTNFLESDEVLRARLADMLSGTTQGFELSMAQGPALDEMAKAFGTRRLTSPEHVVVQYYVIRRNLKLTAGKVGAQVGHAAMFFMEAFQNVSHTWRMLSEEEEARTALVLEWRAGEYGKIILGAGDKEFEELKKNYAAPSSFLVIDNGHTQVDPNTETCLGFWPMRKSQRCDLLRTLKPLY